MLKIEPVKLVNLTDQVIKIRSTKGIEWLVQPSGMVARLVTKTNAVAEIDLGYGDVLFPVLNTDIEGVEVTQDNKPEKLPMPIGEKGTMFIVFPVILRALHRRDLLAWEQKRTKEGRILPERALYGHREQSGM